jgi:hypothetical protein
MRKNRKKLQQQWERKPKNSQGEKLRCGHAFLYPEEVSENTALFAARRAIIWTNPGYNPG